MGDSPGQAPGQAPSLATALSAAYGAKPCASPDPSGLMPLPIEYISAPLSDCFGERFDRSTVTDEQRELWAQDLRERQRAARERERNRVLVDREFEDWE
jgi:hypothetical protein